MSVEDTEKDDIIAQEEDDSTRLIIRNHLLSGDAEHLFLLQETINTSVTSIGTGHIAEHREQASRVEIKGVMFHDTDADDREFLMHARAICGRSDNPFRLKVQRDA